jgi:tRNA1(Val) A37 N6-methylase TrmN6
MSFDPKRAEGAQFETTEDAVLGGRLRLRQPRRGHRVGHDAILLAAATGARSSEHAIDLGAGVGAAGLALASRVPGLRVTLVELDSQLAKLAGENARANGLGERVTALALDVTAPENFEAAGLKSGAADRVLMNPPFNDPQRQNVSPDARRRLAHVGGLDTLPLWIAAAVRLLGPHGVLTMIWRADELAQVLNALAGNFAAVAVLPVHPKPGAPAIRVIVRAAKAGRAPLKMYSELYLNDAEGCPSPAAEAVLRESKPLQIAEI